MAELSNIGNVESFVASGDLSGAQYKFVQANGNDVYLGNSGYAEGVLQNKPQNNEHAAVVVMGGTKIIVASSLGPNIFVGCGSGGYAVSGFDTQGAHYGRLLQGATSGGIGVLYFTQTGTL